MSEDEGPRIRDQGVISYAGTLVDAAVSFVGLVLFANALGAASIGDFYTLLAIVSLLTFPAAGVGQGIQKRGSEAAEEPAPYLGAGVVVGAAYLALIGLIVAGLVAADVTGGFTLGETLTALAVLVTRVVFLLINDAYRAQGKTGFATLADNALGVTETVVQIGFLLMGFRVVGLLAGTAVATTVAVVVHLAVTSVRVGVPASATFRSLSSFTRWTTATAGLNTFYDRLPVLALVAFSSSTVVGYYTAANRLLMLGSHVGGSLAPTLMVRASRKTTDDGEPDSASDLTVTLRFVGIVAIPMAFGAGVFPGTLMEVVFDFSGGAMALVGLGLYHVINSADTVTNAFAEGVGRPEYSLRATVVALVVRLAVVGAVVIPFGLVGVVGAVVVSHATRLVTVYAALRREFGGITPPLGVGFQVGASLLMTGVVAGLADTLRIDGWPTLVSVVGVGAACYGLFLFVGDRRFRAVLLDGVRTFRLSP